MLIVNGNEKVLLPLEAIEVVADGTITEPQLNHPEGICCDDDGFIWCGGERGEIYRIDPEQGSFDQVATTNGFALGLNFDRSGNLYICDLKHKAVFRYHPESRVMSKFSDGDGKQKMRLPNYPLYDPSREVLFVSDSYGFGERGPGIWRIDLATGRTELWCDHIFDFANGLALSLDGHTLFLAESRGNRNIYRIEIKPDGTCGTIEPFISLRGTIPDGLAMGPDEVLYMTCYEPSRIYCLDLKADDAVLEILAEDPTAHLFCHPTNCVVRGGELYVSNLGRWHISKVKLPSLT